MPDHSAYALAATGVRVVHLHCDYPEHGLRKGDRITMDASGELMLIRDVTASELPPDLAFLLGRMLNPLELGSRSGPPLPPPPRSERSHLSLVPANDPEPPQ